MQSDTLSKHTRGPVSLCGAVWPCLPVGHAEAYCQVAGICFNQVDTEMTLTKEKVYYTHRSIEIGGMTFHAGPRGEAPGSVRRLGEERTVTRVCIVDSVEGTGEAGYVGLGLAV